MEKIGVIGGTLFFSKGISGNFKERAINTAYGPAIVFISEKFVFVPRHGKNKDIPPHRINHRANISALKHLGINKIIGLGSSGSLKKISLPSIAVPDDYICLWDISTFFDNKIMHITPAFNEELRKKIILSAKKLKMKVMEKGVYINTLGPRLETRAEIRMLKNFGDFVGMTIAKEAALAQELGMGYAAILSIDNYCNGIIKESLDFRQIQKNAAHNSGNIVKLLNSVIGWA